MGDYAARQEAALEEEARQRAEEIRVSEASAAQTEWPDTGPAPDAEVAHVRRSGRHHDHTDTAGSQHLQLDRSHGHGPRR